MKYQVPVVFTVKAESEQKAEEYVDRLLRHGFSSISEYERPTWKAISRWAFAAIRRRK